MSSEAAASGLNPAFPSADWLADLRARGSNPAFAEARAALDERVEGYHRVLPDLPARQAGYYHEFFCPHHAVQLVFDPRDGHHHACPVDGVVYSGEPFDSAWGWSVNDALSDAALRASVRRALGHAPQRAEADAALLRHVLLGYAERYRTMPAAPQGHPDQYSGMVCWSALDESVWIIRLVWAAALARGTFSKDEQGLLCEGLFRPALKQLHLVRYQQIQNVGNWDRGAILALGLILANEAAIDEAIDERYGIRDQLARGVTADGLWWELSLSYHFYVLGALSWTIRAFRASGRPFADEAVVQRMFQAPLDLAFPDASLPATNDCWYHIGLTGEVGHGIPSADGFYEIAYGWFRDPNFAWVVGENRRAGRPRATLEALLDGAAEIPAVKRGGPESRHFRGSGLAVLRSPGSGVSATLTEERSTVVILKAAGDGDAHGHPDQLGIALFGAGTRIALDPGTPGYGIALNDTWYRQTAAHSTVLLDSRSQPPGSGRITRFDVVEGVAVVEAEVAWPGANLWDEVTRRAVLVSWPDRDPSRAYAGVSMRRTLAVGDGWLVDSFRVDSPGERTIDWLLHLPADAAPIRGDVMAAERSSLSGPCGYDQLTHIRSLAPAGPGVVCRLSGPQVAVEMHPVGSADVARFLASAPGNPAAVQHSLLVRRRTARAATFGTVVRFRPGVEIPARWLTIADRGV